MNAQSEVAVRMEKIREIFQHAMSIAKEKEDFKSLVAELDNTENEFRSIAYEGAAMALALKDFSDGHTLNHWRLFMEGPGNKHSAQVHAGLGWAIAQQRISALPFIETLDPIMRFRMLDGCGYYDGIFRQRQTIAKQTMPTDLADKLLSGYDQGVGRSLWYISKGACAKIPEMISAFSPSRHNDLWRGVGIACVYVGGFDFDILSELLNYSLSHHTQLAVAAALVAQARNNAETLTPDTELACRVWCNCSTQEAILVTEKSKQSATLHPDDAYKTWLRNIEEELAAVKTN